MIDKNITDISKWSELTRGGYRYVISPGAAYELYIERQVDDDIMHASASIQFCMLFNEDHHEVFERTAIYEGQVYQCLQEAYNDLKENVT